ncbi:MAG TPA: hopanoid-associated sugar epimerase [Alphaproteobacteria bacterium]|nr:hopanoid-associated sugar epimerase [Alphaproteobacteria bacterium]
MSETALVTGATGFLGSSVARALVGAGHRVRVLARPSSDRRNLTDLDAEIVEGDLAAPETLPSALKGCTALFHVAADYRLWVRDPATMYRINVDGSDALIRAAAAANVSRVVYTSSVATLGIDPSGAGDEDTPVALANMVGHYKRSKFLAEEAVGKAARETGLPVVVVNPSTPIGPRDIKPTPTGQTILMAASGRMPAYVETGLNLVHVDDCAEGHLLAFAKGKPGERYILGGDDFSLAAMQEEIARITGGKPARIKLPVTPLYPVAMIAELLARFTGKEPLLMRDTLRMARKRMFFSSAKAARDLGYRTRPAREGLVDAIAWFKQAGYLK